MESCRFYLYASVWAMVSIPFIIAPGAFASEPPTPRPTNTCICITPTPTATEMGPATSTPTGEWTPPTSTDTPTGTRTHTPTFTGTRTPTVPIGGGTPPPTGSPAATSTDTPPPTSTHTPTWTPRYCVCTPVPTPTQTLTPTPTGGWIHQAHELWWFDGEKPSGYHWCVTLAGVNLPPADNYDWQVVEGADKVDLAVACESVGDAYSTLDAIGLISTAASGHNAWGDVVITVSVAGTEQARIATQVFAPDHSVHLRDEDSGTGSTGFQSLIWYYTEDNFERIINPDPGHSEKFTSEHFSDFEGENWPAYEGWSAIFEGAEWCDYIRMIGHTMYPVALPPPPTPTPLSDVKVDHWFGDWRCGSVICGKGVKVLSDVKWQRYLDHGRHE